MAAKKECPKEIHVPVKLSLSPRKMRIVCEASILALIAAISDAAETGSFPVGDSPHGKMGYLECRTAILTLMQFHRQLPTTGLVRVTNLEALVTSTVNETDEVFFGEENMTSESQEWTDQLHSSEESGENLMTSESESETTDEATPSDLDFLDDSIVQEPGSESSQPSSSPPDARPTRNLDSEEVQRATEDAIWPRPHTGPFVFPTDHVNLLMNRAMTAYHARNRHLMAEIACEMDGFERFLESEVRRTSPGMTTVWQLAPRLEGHWITVKEILRMRLGARPEMN